MTDHGFVNTFGRLASVVALCSVLGSSRAVEGAVLGVDAEMVWLVDIDGQVWGVHRLYAYVTEPTDRVLAVVGEPANPTIINVFSRRHKHVGGERELFFVR